LSAQGWKRELKALDAPAVPDTANTLWFAGREDSFLLQSRSNAIA
jgi:hypothetical protein